MENAGRWGLGSLLALAALGCNPGGVGDPCIPEDEYSDTFSGFSIDETNVESRSFQCETRICLVNHFQGRVSCPAGQNAAAATTAPTCAIPGTVPVPSDPNHPDNIKVQVDPQLVERQTEQAVYCSCRCDGPDQNARYCECPEGFQCEKLVDDLGLEGGNLAGSYCIRSGSRYDPVATTTPCDAVPQSCGP
jgi:hypothetical protein